MENLDMFQYRSGKIYEFGWWDLEIISSDAGKKLTLTDSKEEVQTCRVHLTLADPEHQEINGQVKVTWKKFYIISISLMVHVRVSEAYIHFTLMYTPYHIFPVLPIKYLINEDCNPTTPFKLTMGTKASVSHLRVSFCPCVVRKVTAHVNKRL